MGFLIDSDVLIALERERLSMDQIATDLSEHPLAISAVTASELLHGIHRAQEPEIRQKRSEFVEYLLDLFPVIAVDLEVARVHAQLWATLQSQGKMIGAHDLLIAATALTLGYGVVTLNKSEFQRIPDLPVYDPPVAPSN